MFKKGDRVHLHDGSIVEVRRKNSGNIRRPKSERSLIRGFIRASLVDCLTGEEQAGDWHENIVTQAGHQMIVRNFVGIQSSHSSAVAVQTSDVGWARYWGIGNFTEAASSNFSTIVSMHSEYGVSSTQTTGSRIAVSSGIQALSGTWSLSQSFQYASSHISHAVALNCIGQFVNASAGTGTALSLATFASSTKGTTQALNVTYNWLFSTA